MLKQLIVFGNSVKQKISCWEPGGVAQSFILFLKESEI